MKTETRKRKTESVEDLDARIIEMEAELADGHVRPLTWDEVTSATAEELAAKERRDEAQGRWAIRLSAVQSADGRTDRARRELHELQGGE